MNQTIRNRINQIKSGQVPEGYEKTSFGVFPVDWEKKKKVKDICIFQYGKPLKEEDRKGGSIPVYSSAGIVGYHNESINKDKDGIIIGRKGSAGSVHYSKTPFYCIDTAFFIESKEIRNNYFLYQIINKIKFDRELSDSAVPGLNREIAYSKLVAYPKSQTEQAKIAEILMKWDEAIEAQEQLIQKLEIRKKALMQKLLTPKEGWKKVKLSKVLTQGSKKPVNTNKYRKITIKLKLKGIEFSELCREMADTRPFYVRYTNEIIIGKQNYFNGSIALVSSNFNNCICSNAIMSFKVVNEETKFIFYSLSRNDYIKKYEMLANGTGQKELSEKDFLNFDVFLPNRNDQKRIANILSLADKEIELHKQQLEQLTKQRKSMMQLLLTGIVRTVDNGQWTIENGQLRMDN